VIIPVRLSEKWHELSSNSESYSFYIKHKSEVLMVNFIEDSHGTAVIHFTGKVLEDSINLRGAISTFGPWYNILTPTEITHMRLRK
jgi:hypothetical protein